MMMMILMMMMMPVIVIIIVSDDGSDNVDDYSGCCDIDADADGVVMRYIVVVVMMMMTSTMVIVIMSRDHDLYDNIIYNVNYYIIPLTKMTYFVCVFYRYDIDKPTPKLSDQVSTYIFN